MTPTPTGETSAPSGGDARAILRELIRLRDEVPNPEMLEDEDYHAWAAAEMDAFDRARALLSTVAAPQAEPVQTVQGHPAAPCSSMASPAPLSEPRAIHQSELPARSEDARRNVTAAEDSLLRKAALSSGKVIPHPDALGAAMYRWLRDKSNSAPDNTPTVYSHRVVKSGRILHGAGLDAAIAAAMSPSVQAKQEQ